jgi:hydrogenase small subunit
MILNRRDFLRLTGGAAALAACPSAILRRLSGPLQEAVRSRPVYWLQGQSCSGCSVSLLNASSPDFATLVTRSLQVDFHQTVCGGTGAALMGVLERAEADQRKDFLLVLEGSIPVASPLFCTLGERQGVPRDFADWIRALGANAAALVAVGTCAAFGGIPASGPRPAGVSPTGAVPFSKLFPERTILRIPGCPPHPDWIAGTLVHWLLQGLPALDNLGRPKMFFEASVHEKCARLPDFEADRYARTWGNPGCLYELGCLGPDTVCDIPTRRWLGVQSCTDGGAGCIGCTEPGFPDAGGRGLYPHVKARPVRPAGGGTVPYV